MSIQLEMSSIQIEALLNQYYQQHQPWLYKQLYQRLQNSADAEDICQQVFLRLCEQPQLLVTLKSPRAWLLAVGQRLCIDLWRKSERRQKVYTEVALLKESVAPSAEKITEVQQLLDKVQDSLCVMPHKTSAIYVEYNFGHHSGVQVAKRYSVSLSTVRNYVKQTKQHLLAQVM